MSYPQLNLINNGPGLLIKTILWRLFCFLSFVAKDGKDGNGLKIENIRLNFSGFDAISTKKYQKHIMGCAFLKHFITYSPHSLSGTFCV